MLKKYIIVEGMYDQIFYKLLFKKIKLKDIQITVPQDHGSSTYNGKGNCLITLDSLIESSKDGSVKKIGIILDADFKDISEQGFSSTLKQIKKIVSPYGYNIKTKSCDYHKGILIHHPKGLPDIAVWIMPNNSKEGYLEHFLQSTLIKSHKEPMTEAKSICTNLTTRLFSPHHTTKSELSIFMAMQENPGRNIGHLIGKDIIKLEDEPMKSFIKFLKEYYKK